MIETLALHVAKDRGTLGSLTRRFTSTARHAIGPGMHLEDLAEAGKVTKDGVFDAFDELITVYNNPLSSLADSSATCAHAAVAAYVNDFCTNRTRISFANSNDSITIGRDITLTIPDLVSIARDGKKVELNSETYELLFDRRNQFEEYLSTTGKAIYGTNTGFGPNQNRPVSEEDLAQLQINLIRSHSTGVGEPAPIDIVRATMFLRARSLINGNSGVRPMVVQQLIDFLNEGITPVVPAYGSVGASGDLAPLSHIALALIGEGDVFYKGQRMLAAQAIEQAELAKLKPLQLEMKEGLALNNGVQYSTAMAALASSDLENLFNTACLSTAITAQVMLGKEDPFRDDLHDLRPHSGAKKAATLIRNFIEDSPIIKTMKKGHDGNSQDPYNLRCSPQILGASLDNLDHAKEVIETEMNSATDNPLFLRDETTGQYTTVVSGGHFHGAPIAMELYHLIEASANAANLIYTRCARYVDSARNRGMKGDLAWLNLTARERSTSSAMMIPEYVSAALANAILGNAMPSQLFNFPTAQGQEDHVSMAPNLGIRLHREIIPTLTNALAIELSYCAQAAAIREASETYPSSRSLTRDQNSAIDSELVALEAAVAKQLAGTPFAASVDIKLECPWNREERGLSPSCQQAVDRIHNVFPPVTQDRIMSGELEAIARLVSSGELLEIARTNSA